MQRYKKDGMEWLEFDLLADIPNLKHAVFLRHGGHSQGPYAELNSSFFVGDDPLLVQKNVDLMEGMFPCSPVWGRGVHEKTVAYVDKKSPREIVDCDGLITSTPGMSLFMKHADCQVALMYDPKNHAIAAVHAGWRGSVQNIFAESVKMFKDRFGTNPADLLVGIGPSLGPDQAEFVNYRNELPEDFWGFQVRPTYFDFWGISEYQLESVGVLPHHIEIARLCTYGNAYDFFSFRRDRVTGRHASVIALST